MDNVINLGFDIIKEICKWHNVDIKVVTNVERYMEILQLVDNIGE